MRLRKPTLAAVITIRALVVALSGTAVAASHYIITSTNQIKPSVLRALRTGTATKGTPAVAAAQGRQGPPSPPGPAGAEGVPGSTGANGIGGSQDVPGDARAYALVRPPCDGCELGAGFTPLAAAQSGTSHSQNHMVITTAHLLVRGASCWKAGSIPLPQLLQPDRDQDLSLHNQRRQSGRGIGGDQSRFRLVRRAVSFPTESSHHEGTSM
jgi:hypothetical protein